MPTYDYQCKGCGHEFELFQQMSAPVKKKCPECGKLKLQRLIGTGAGVLFKGSGFYETDYRSESYKKAAEAEKSETKSDSKTDARKDGKKDGQQSGKKDAKPQASSGTASSNGTISENTSSSRSSKTPGSSK